MKEKIIAVLFQCSIKGHDHATLTNNEFNEVADKILALLPKEEAKKETKPKKP